MSITQKQKKVGNVRIVPFMSNHEGHNRLVLEADKINYIFDQKATKTGAVVIDTEGNLGWSLCAPMDHFDSFEAVYRALMRASYKVNWKKVLERKFNKRLAGLGLTPDFEKHVDVVMEHFSRLWALYCKILDVETAVRDAATAKFAKQTAEAEPVAFETESVAFKAVNAKFAKQAAEVIK